MSIRSRGFIPAFLVLSLLFSAVQAQQKLSYPTAKKVDQVDDYHGTKVADPYRWLEDPDAADSRAWIEAQNKVTFAYLEKLPKREQLKERLTELWNYERYSAPFKRGGKYFYSKNDGLQNQSVVYIADSPEDPGRVLIDPNKFSKDGTIALSGMAITEDGKTLAYGISKAGSDWREFKFMDIETGKELPDHLKHIKFSGVSWTKDGKGVFYSRYPEPNEATKLEDANLHRKLYYHELGTDQSEDVLVYERPDNPKMGINGFVTEDGEWLLIYLSDGTSRKNQVYYKSLTLKDAPIVPLIDKFENQYSYVGNDGATFFFETDKDAPLGRLVAVNVLARTRVWREVIPQAAETLTGVSFINNQFVADYLKDAYTQIKIYDIEGKFVRDVELPGIGSAGGFGGRREDTETFYTYSSYNAPPTIYRYDMKTGKSTLFRRAEVDFNPDDYEVKQVFYPSKDGTKVPMFIVHKKGIKLDGSNPTLLYGYGGFNISMTPGFSTSRIVWLEMGGVYAVANLRGGGEYGEKWHQAGTKLKKQNVFDDFIAAGEWLIANKYTSSEKLAIQGGSNGGLLVGAVLNQRPDLFGAALPAVGVMDMLRFHKFTIGFAWTSDYGSSENPEEFKALYAYSPLHNIKKGTNYPAVLVTTADHDDRVVPAHSFKYAATLQEAQAGYAPVLIRIETDAGHGAGKPTSKIIEELADTYAFLMENLGVD
ncbi:MAG: S9 family peptidase [Aridibacter famidurans]|nr:S9 family peptidase [Aridibacter famidurans]